MPRTPSVVHSKTHHTTRLVALTLIVYSPSAHWSKSRHQDVQESGGGGDGGGDGGGGEGGGGEGGGGSGPKPGGYGGGNGAGEGDGGGSGGGGGGALSAPQNAASHDGGCGSR